MNGRIDRLRALLEEPLLVTNPTNVLYLVGFTYTFRITIRLFEHTLAGVRMRIAAKLANAELLVLDRVGKARIYQSLTQDTTVIAESQGVLVAPFGGPGRFRAVTHLDVDDAGIARAIDAVRDAARSVLLR